MPSVEPFSVGTITDPLNSVFGINAKLVQLLRLTRKWLLLRLKYSRDLQGTILGPGLPKRYSVLSRLSLLVHTGPNILVMSLSDYCFWMFLICAKHASKIEFQVRLNTTMGIYWFPDWREWPSTPSADRAWSGVVSSYDMFWAHFAYFARFPQTSLSKRKPRGCGTRGGPGFMSTIHLSKRSGMESFSSDSVDLCQRLGSIFVSYCGVLLWCPNVSCRISISLPSPGGMASVKEIGLCFSSFNWMSDFTVKPFHFSESNFSWFVHTIAPYSKLPVVSYKLVWSLRVHTYDLTCSYTGVLWLD